MSDTRPQARCTPSGLHADTRAVRVERAQGARGARRGGAGMAGSLLAGTLCLCSVLVLAADAVRVPGTRVSMSLPDGFGLSERFAGIADEARAASVQVIELPAPVADMRDDMTADALAGRGLVVRSRDEVEAGIDNALLLDVLQSAQGVDYRLLILVAGSPDSTVLLTARTPDPVDPALDAVLRQTLLGATRSQALDTDPLEGLSFALEPTGGLVIAPLMMGSTVMLSLEGRTTITEPGEPFMLVARSEQVPPLADDPYAYAEQRLARTDGIESFEVLERRELQVDNLPAVELLARARGENGIESVVLQLLVLEPDGHLMSQGHVAAGAADEWIDAFRRIGQSIRLQRR